MGGGGGLPSALKAAFGRLLDRQGPGRLLDRQGAEEAAHPFINVRPAQSSRRLTRSGVRVLGLVLRIRCMRFGVGGLEFGP